MKKAITIISDNNKGKFISKGFSNAFKKLSFFVYDMKIYDFDVNAINKIAPDIIFIFWSDIREKSELQNSIEAISCDVDFIHCAEFLDDIPQNFQKMKGHYIFAGDNKNKKNKYIQPVSASDYKAYFNGYKYNITFAGNPSYKNREIILSQLIKNFGRINIFSRSFDFYKSLDEIAGQKLLNEYELELYNNSYKGCADSTKELADIYASSKINIDIANERFKDINYRLLEITASGGFVIAPFSIGAAKQYDKGKDIETYRDIYELTDKTEFYLKNTNLAQMIALNGKKNTVSNFSYYDKLKTMLKVIYGKNFSSR